MVGQHRAEFQQAAQNVISVSANDNFTKLLFNCSDRVMRLYWIDYSALSPHNKSASVFKLIDGFFDVINHKRWLN